MPEWEVLFEKPLARKFGGGEVFPNLGEEFLDQRRLETDLIVSLVLQYLG